MIKLLYAVKTTEKYEHRIDSILNTWLSEGDYLCYSDHENQEKNIIKVCEDASYAALEIKGLNFFNSMKDIKTKSGDKILEYYDWIFLVDDDTFVNKKMLNEFVLTCDEDKAYGYIFTPQTHPDNPIYTNTTFKDAIWYSGGGGLLISANALTKIPYYQNYNTYADDVSVGINLMKHGINLIHSDLFRSEPPEHYGETDRDIKQKITYHHIDPNRMYTLNNLATL
jgi:hypothetical protein